MTAKTLEQFAQIAGKCALVTGSTSGIGAATARALAAQGCNVMLHGLADPGEAAQRVAEIKAEYNVKAAFHGANLTDLKQIEDLIATTERELGPIEILVNNAVARNFDAVDQLSTERWNYAVAVNLSAPFHLIKLTLPGMKQRKWGRIINIASNWGLTGTVNRSDYVATKHGVIGLTKAVALEALPYNVTCNAICPGSTLTPHAERQVRERMSAGNKSWEEAARDLLAARQPSGRFVKPEQVADLIVFLCSPSANEMTGSPVSIDGGWYAI
jgi:3-hydroxybutyrate dehydrogenase